MYDMLNKIVAEKENAQKKIAKECNYDLKKMAETAHKTALALSKKYGIKLDYTTPEINP